MVGLGMPGMTEWVVILVIVLIFFGAGKLPEVFSQAGKGLRAFKDAADGKDGDRPKDAEADAPAARSARRLAVEDDLDGAPESGSARPRARASDDAAR
jgi:sec-independent protein translocase protein TatA